MAPKKALVKRNVGKQEVEPQKQQGTAAGQPKIVELTEAEKKRNSALIARVKSTPGPATWKNNGKGPSGKPIVTYEMPKGNLDGAARLCGATGTVYMNLAEALIGEVANATFQPFQDPAEHYNIISAAMTGLAPKDELEGLLVAQMVSAHKTAIECLRRASHQDQTFEGRRLYLTFADRFLRTFTAQMDSLTRYRKGGQQKVTVEHVHVYPGGKAAVGVFNHTGGEQTGGRGDGYGNSGTTSCIGHIENKEQDVTLELPKCEALPCEDQEGNTLHDAGDAKRKV